ncbi:hypothetical protein, partial [Klebsiella pneumoniae]|uniref:hypothetical protein n=1 Tax=Klebsiella pneumoniae TaxID=573 RepID=UPI003B5A2CC9
PGTPAAQRPETQETRTEPQQKQRERDVEKREKKALAAQAKQKQAANRGNSVIHKAPNAAHGALQHTDPGVVGPSITGQLMEKMDGKVKHKIPEIQLGADIGKQ